MLETLSDRDKMLAGYLLNELGEKELFALEDEMLLDDELFERMQVVEMNLIDSYVRGEMSSEEHALFARQFLATRENAEKVAAARAFQEGLGRLRERQADLVAAAAVDEAPAPPLRRPTWAERAASLFRLPAPALAFAALALLAIVVGLLWLKWPQRRDNAPNEVVNTSPAPGKGPREIVSPPAPSPEAPVNAHAPAPQPPPPKLQKPPAPPRDELAQLPQAGDTQDVWVYRLDPTRTVTLGGGAKITIEGDKKTLRLKCQLPNEDLKKRDRFKVSVVDDSGNPVFPEGGSPVEVSPVKGGGRLWHLAVDVPAAAFKNDGTYYFRIHDPDVRIPLLVKRAAVK
ncbi:MAG TPA: hypothetical protein VJ866_08590 [Pyrinomonadaceae bacterium]|nr:hypothetical protein [Pyrinomonadaceae bacterium]